MWERRFAYSRRLEPQCLYRFYDDNEALLYVGITNSLPNRLGQHNESKRWWCDVSVVTVEHYDSREEVLEAEKRAIEFEEPRYNIQHAGRRARYRVRRRVPKIRARHKVIPARYKRRMVRFTVKTSFAAIAIYILQWYARIHFGIDF